MPTISRFYGIIIKMYFQQSEHNPPHFHVVYGENLAEIEISTGKILEGYLPPRAKSLVSEWLELHKDELNTIWNTQEFFEIEPLE